MITEETEYELYVRGDSKEELTMLNSYPTEDAANRAGLRAITDPAYHGYVVFKVTLRRERI